LEDAVEFIDDSMNLWMLKLTVVVLPHKEHACGSMFAVQLSTQFLTN
jgi:hypothetical protein